jgi:hypothetical protein
MSRPKSDNSVATLVSLLLVNNSIHIENKSLSSVAVMVSNLKKREGQQDKKFKIKQEDNTVTVTRVI